MAESDDNLLLFNQNAWQRVSRQILNTLCGLCLLAGRVL